MAPATPTGSSRGLRLSFSNKNNGSVGRSISSNQMAGGAGAVRVILPMFDRYVGMFLFVEREKYSVIFLLLGLL